jgi:hypothetical protein
MLQVARMSIRATFPVVALTRQHQLTVVFSTRGPGGGPRHGDALCSQADESRAGEIHFVMQLTNSATVNCCTTR